MYTLFQKQLRDIYNKLIKIENNLLNVSERINKCGDICDELSSKEHNSVVIKTKPKELRKRESVVVREF